MSQIKYDVQQYTIYTTKWRRCFEMFQVKKVAKKWPVRDRNGWSEERGEQTKYIGEWFQENVSKTNIKSTTSSAKIAKQSAQKLESWCTTFKAWQLQHL